MDSQDQASKPVSTSSQMSKAQSILIELTGAQVSVSFPDSEPRDLNTCLAAPRTPRSQARVHQLYHTMHDRQKEESNGDLLINGKECDAVPLPKP